MLLYVVLGCFFGVLGRLDGVTVRQVCVVTSSFVKALLMMAGGFAMMTRSVLEMLRCLLVMVRCFVRHGNSSRRAGILAAREDYRHPTGHHGLQPHECKMKRNQRRWRTSAPN